jgi:RND family efflux transporter MFP subunit
MIPPLTGYRTVNLLVMPSYAASVARAIATLSTVLVIAACGADAPKPVSAASVANPVPEGALTTVRLSVDAVRRLAIATEPVESASVQPTRTVGGEVVVPPGLSVVVAAPVAGTVLAPESGALPAAGSRVARGATLLRLAPLPPDLAQAERDLSVTRARLQQAQAESARTARLFAERLVSAREQERAQAELATARATAEAVEAQLRLVRGGRASGLTTLRVTTPSEGIVRTLSVAPGQSVAAGAPLAEVLRTDRLWIRVPLYAGDARLVRATASAGVRALGGPTDGPMTSATPVAAPPSADATAASVDLYYEMRGAVATLRPGERVSVTLSLVGGGVERGLTVPVASLVRDLSGGTWVYERADSVTFVRRRVEVARLVGDRAVLALGPAVGARIVTSGAAELFGTEFGAGK